MPSLLWRRSFVFGLNCTTGAVNQKIRSNWEERLNESDAVLLDVTDGIAVSDIIQMLRATLNPMGVRDLKTVPVVFALFFDLRENWDPQRLRELSDFPRALAELLEPGSYTQVTFGYADRQRANASLRNAKALAEAHHCILIADPILQQEGEWGWKPAMTFLELLRRGYPGIPENMRVGYFRFLELDVPRLTALECERNRLGALLGSGGEVEARDKLEHLYQQLFQRAEREFPVDGNLQPLHPDLVVTGWLRKFRARKGRLASFRRARQCSEAAVRGTGAALRARLTECLAAPPNGVRPAEFFEVLGQALLENRSAIEGMLTAREQSQPPVPPELTYVSPIRRTDAPLAPYVNAVTDYLQAVRASAVTEVYETLLSSLLTYYRSQPEYWLSDRRQRLSGELSNCQVDIAAMPGRRRLIDIADAGYQGLSGEFHGVTPGGSSKPCLLFADPQSGEAARREHPQIERDIYCFDVGSRPRFAADGYGAALQLVAFPETNAASAGFTLDDRLRELL